MSHCYHCGETLPAGTPIRAELAGDTREFCCHACLGVAELIHGGGLSRYYTTRNARAPRPQRQFPHEHWLAYDLPAVAAQYVHEHQGEKEIHLFIDGIHCAACSYLIKGALQQQHGIEHAFINATTGRAEIRWHTQKLSDILATIANLGYTPNLFTPEAGEARQHRERNQHLLRLIVSGLASMQIMMFAFGFYTAPASIDATFAQYLRWLSLALTTPVIFYAGWPFLKSAWHALKNRRVNMDVPIAAAALGAYLASAWHTLLGHGEIYFESVAMFIFFLSVSRFLEFLTRRRARLNEYRFARLLPEAVERVDGTTTTLVPLATVQPGDTLRILPTPTIAVDGHILTGHTRVNEAMLSGESTPVAKTPGDKVLAGSTNLESPIHIRVSQTGQQTTLAGIRRIILRAEQHRAPQIERNEKLAEHTIVLILAALGYLIWQIIDPSRAFDIALAVLVATCPCALSLATPTALTAAMNRAHRAAILIKNTDTLERLPAIRHILFDKTGTLTQGRFQLQNATIHHPDPTHIWQLAKSLEQHSSHPIAWYFTRQDIPTLPLDNIRQHSGQGIAADWQGERHHIGSAAFIAEHCPNIPLPPAAARATTVHLATPNTLLATFILSDPLRADIPQTLAKLRDHTLHIASGDKHDNVKALADHLGIEHYQSEQSAEDKLHYLQHLDAPTLMIGDGINDAPVMAGASVSVAVGRANPLSQTHADIVCLEHGPEALPFLFNLARRTRRIIRQNLAWATAYNLLVLPLAALGHLTPWIAALGMSASSLIVVGNALRVYRIPLPDTTPEANVQR
ncbi:MAG: heavy metal translocating P-type ATPase [Cardiobacteriaceae bacterium]|nr:heavy metal translocating P-type ATPase [Cardiobacteriaceae bacterium]